MSISLKQMKYALAVAGECHFGRAASACHVSQPALSQQIRLLEDFCGTPLFDRLGKSVQLTPFGRAFIPRAQSIVQNAQALNAFATSRDGVPDRPLKFGIIPTIAPYLLPAIYPALAKTLPHIDFRISENRTENLLDDVQTGSLDLALIATELPQNSRLRQTPLFSDPFVLASPKQAAGQKGPVDLAMIDTNKLLLLDEGHCLRDQAIEACALRGPDAARAFAATSLSTIVEFVANGQGVTLLPAISLAKEASNTRITLNALKAPGAGRQLALVWHNATPFEKLFETMSGIIIEAGEPMVSSKLG